MISNKRKSPHASVNRKSREQSVTWSPMAFTDTQSCRLVVPLLPPWKIRVLFLHLMIYWRGKIHFQRAGNFLQKRSHIKKRICSPWEQILSFYRRPLFIYWIASRKSQKLPPLRKNGTKSTCIKSLKDTDLLATTHIFTNISLASLLQEIVKLIIIP